MGYAYQSDGSVICTGDADPTRTATYAGPKNSTAQINSVVAFFALEPARTLTPGTMEWLLSLAPYMSAPAGVADASNKGTAALLFAMGDHVHASRIRKERKTGINTATYTWTYPTPFDAGVVPVCQAIVEDPANSTIDSYNVQVVGAPTNTSVLFRIIRQTSGLFGLLTGAIGFNPTPSNVNLHCAALQP